MDQKVHPEVVLGKIQPERACCKVARVGPLGRA